MTGAERAAPRSARRRAREFTLQGLYQWQLSGTAPETVAAQLAEAEGAARMDADYFRRLLIGVTAEADALQAAIQPCLDRPWGQVSPVERAILLVAAFELARAPDVPYRVVINEAVELAKRYGGTDGHKFVNGVLDRLAAAARPAEAGAAAGR
jgi:N utilization substance protein B